ncbi:uncharacterized protein LOC124405918 [Diprion similis]|uniref:uncharacterized protein LOC124405918 n=1 Tax=Diprion similis TaxID=362088 RepID=UPI001EF8C9D0|nr:uncharacterized protein LOC124405918 [Diprion similis]
MAAKYSVKFFGIIKVMLYGFKIIGLAPFSVENFENSIYLWALHSSNLGLVYNILLSLLLLILTTVSFRNSVSMNYENKSTLTTINDAVLGILAACTAWIIIISWAFKQSKAADIVNKILELDFRVTLKKERSNERTFIMVSIYVTINACLWICEWVQQALLSTVPTLVLIYFTIPYLIISMFIVEYCVVVRLIVKELESVNEILSDCIDFRNNLYPRALFLSCNNSEVLSLPNNNQLTVLQSAKLTGRIVHKLLSKTTKPEIKSELEQFSLHLLHEEFYFTACGFFKLDFTLLHAMMATMATYLAKQTGLEVHKLMATTAIPEIKAELEEFSLRILHEELNFKACGFSQLDFTLLHSTNNGLRQLEFDCGLYVRIIADDN